MKNPSLSLVMFAHGARLAFNPVAQPILRLSHPSNILLTTDNHKTNTPNPSSNHAIASIPTPPCRDHQLLQQTTNQPEAAASFDRTRQFAAADRGGRPPSHVTLSWISLVVNNHLKDAESLIIPRRRGSIATLRRGRRASRDSSHGWTYAQDHKPLRRLRTGDDRGSAARF